jgi:hypothetical protein
MKGAMHLPAYGPHIHSSLKPGGYLPDDGWDDASF